MHGEFHFWQHRFQDAGMGYFLASYVGDAHPDVRPLHEWSQLNENFYPPGIRLGGDFYIKQSDFLWWDSNYIGVLEKDVH